MRFIGLITIIPQFILLIAVLMYVSRRSTAAEGILMLIGIIVGLFATIFNIVGLPWLFDLYGSGWYTTYGPIIGAVHTLAGLCFAVGFLILVQNALKTKP